MSLSLINTVDDALGLVSERDKTQLLNHTYKEVDQKLNHKINNEHNAIFAIKSIVTFPPTNINSIKTHDYKIEEGKSAARDDEDYQLKSEPQLIPESQSTLKPQLISESQLTFEPQSIKSSDVSLTMKLGNGVLGFNPNPPNNGNRVTCIDQLVDPIKMSNMMTMFNSMSELKKVINPNKFKMRGDDSLSDKKDNQVSETKPANQYITNTFINGQGDEIYIKMDDNFRFISEADSGQTPILGIIEDDIDLTDVVESRDEIRQDWTIADIVTKAVPPGWKNVFDLGHAELEHINTSLIGEEQRHGYFYPMKKDLFKAFDMCPLKNVKVIIIGQDPYHSTNSMGEPIAMGMSFSVSKGTYIPPSLKNIYKELSNNIPEFKIPEHGDLSAWAKQGILMLNSCLTVRKGSPKSHKNLWMGFVSKVITAVNEYNPNCIYVLWGKEAEKIATLTTNKNVILTAPHPSGLSAYRGFIGCNHFTLVNENLEKQGRTTIDWNLG